jgi:hypothetical protein
MILRRTFKSLLLSLFPREILIQGPTIKGHLSIDIRERGKLVTRREGSNIWTLTGREYLAEVMGVAVASTRETFRDDRISYIGVGTGSQAEVAEVTSLANPVAYKTGEFLALLNTPNTFPASGTSARNTSIQFIREFGKGEISLGSNVIVTEAGLFTDGDPDDNWDWEAGCPVSMDAASGRAPFAYKNFEPFTKTVDNTARFVWEVSIS